MIARRRLLFRLASLVPVLTLLRPARADEPALAVIEKASSAAPWASFEFTFELDGVSAPGIAIRLPTGGWYASSMVCPHAKCIVRYFANVDVARDTFDVDAKNPVLGCPCHFSVFDVASGGKVINGPAPSPLLQLSATLEGDRLIIRR